MTRTTGFGTLATGLASVCAFLLMTALPASASTIDWTDWTGASAGTTAGSATGTISGLGLTVSYSGELESLPTSYPSWTPTGTWADGTVVANAPASIDNIIQLFGATGATDTITFSAPVLDPVLAIWSLGAGGTEARFVFNASEPFTIVAGGPSAEYGGSSIYVCSSNPDAVCGQEGNGTVQFNGVFTSITWTNPGFEDWYGFTAGAAGLGSTAVPEPSSLALLGAGLLALLYRQRGHAAKWLINKPADSK